MTPWEQSQSEQRERDAENMRKLLRRGWVVRYGDWVSPEMYQGMHLILTFEEACKSEDLNG
jgi:hypothetical protein